MVSDEPSSNNLAAVRGAGGGLGGSILGMKRQHGAERNGTKDEEKFGNLHDVYLRQIALGRNSFCWG